MKLIFFTGYHGSGKTYTANELLNGFDAILADTGPIIRKKFLSSGIDNFNEWNRLKEKELGQDYSNIIVMDGLKRIIADKRPKYLFVVGNRDINGIKYICNHFREDKIKILLFEKPFIIMKSGYEMRTKKIILDDDFAKILQDDDNRGLLGIKQYCEQHNKNCYIIKNDKYDRDSINLAKQAILKLK